MNPNFVAQRSKSKPVQGPSASKSQGESMRCVSLMILQISRVHFCFSRLYVLGQTAAEVIQGIIPTVQSLFFQCVHKGAINSVNKRSLTSTAIKNPPLLDLYLLHRHNGQEASGTTSVATVTHCTNNLLLHHALPLASHKHRIIVSKWKRRVFSPLTRSPITTHQQTVMRGVLTHLPCHMLAKQLI